MGAGPAGEQIERQRNAVHLDEQRHDEGRERAGNAPRERRSRAVRGSKKLNANRMNTAAFTITRNHRPQAERSSVMAVTSSVSMTAATAVAAMHEEVHADADHERQQ